MYQQNHSAKGWTESTHFSSSLSPINENIHWRLNNPLKHLRKSMGPIHVSSLKKAHDIDFFVLPIQIIIGSYWFYTQ